MQNLPILYTDFGTFLKLNKISKQENFTCARKFTDTGNNIDPQKHTNSVFYRDLLNILDFSNYKVFKKLKRL